MSCGMCINVNHYQLRIGRSKNVISRNLNVAYGDNYSDLVFPLPCFYFIFLHIRYILPEGSYDREYIQHCKITLPAGCRNFCGKKLKINAVF